MGNTNSSSQPQPRNYPGPPMRGNQPPMRGNQPPMRGNQPPMRGNQPPMPNNGRTNNMVPKGPGQPPTSTDPKQVASTMPPQQTIIDNQISPVTTKPLILASSTEQQFSIVNKRPPSPLGGGNPPRDSSTYPPSIPRTYTVSAASLQRAPKIRSNYMIHSSDHKSTHTYGYHNITIMQMNSRDNSSQGNRWYDHDRKDNNDPSTNFVYH